MSDDAKLWAAVLGGGVGTVCLIVQVVLFVRHFEDIWQWYVLDDWMWQQWMVAAVLVGNGAFRTFDKYKAAMDA